MFTQSLCHKNMNVKNECRFGLRLQMDSLRSRSEEIIFMSMEFREFGKNVNGETKLLNIQIANCKLIVCLICPCIVLFVLLNFYHVNFDMANFESYFSLDGYCEIE